jgi:hypothetical protein
MAHIYTSKQKGIKQMGKTYIAKVYGIDVFAGEKRLGVISQRIRSTSYSFHTDSTAKLGYISKVFATKTDAMKFTDNI